MERATGFALLRTTSTGAYAGTIPTSLHYRSHGGADAEAPLGQIKSRMWWSPFLFSSGVESSSGGDKNRAVDDYLEFLEKRYHRIHDDDDRKQDSSPPSTGTKFSALKWLKQGDDAGAADSPEAQQHLQQDAALYVLGVAGLASQQLLLKHHARGAGVAAPRRLAASVAASIGQLSALDKAAATDLEVVDVLSALLDRLKPLARQVTIRRKLLIRYQARQLNALAALFAKALALGPAKAATALWRMGGGRKNVAVTLTAMAAFTVFVIRPLAEFLLASQNA
jgi:hypothetical protein